MSFSAIIFVEEEGVHDPSFLDLEFSFFALMRTIRCFLAQNTLQVMSLGSEAIGDACEPLKIEMRLTVLIKIEEPPQI